MTHAQSARWQISFTPLQCEGRCGRKTISTTTAKCPSLLTDRNLTCTSCSGCAARVISLISFIACLPGLALSLPFGLPGFPSLCLVAWPRLRMPTSLTTRMPFYLPACLTVPHLVSACLLRLCLPGFVYSCVCARCCLISPCLSVPALRRLFFSALNTCLFVLWRLVLPHPASACLHGFA